jgi:hypothetical protein
MIQGLFGPGQSLLPCAECDAGLQGHSEIHMDIGGLARQGPRPACWDMPAVNQMMYPI